MGRLRLTCCEVEEVLHDGAYRRQCQPDPTATVEIDGKFAGDCGDFSGDGKDLAAGKHHLQVDASLIHHSGLTEDIEVPEGARISREAWFDELPD